MKFLSLLLAASLVCLPLRAGEQQSDSPKNAGLIIGVVVLIVGAVAITTLVHVCDKYIPPAPPSPPPPVPAGSPVWGYTVQTAPRPAGPWKDFQSTLVWVNGGTATIVSLDQNGSPIGTNTVPVSGGAFTNRMTKPMTAAQEYYRTVPLN